MEVVNYGFFFLYKLWHVLICSHVAVFVKVGQPSQTTWRLGAFCTLFGACLLNVWHSRVGFEQNEASHFWRWFCVSLTGPAVLLKELHDWIMGHWMNFVSTSRLRKTCSEIVHHFEPELNNNELRIIFIIHSTFLSSSKICGVVFPWEHILSVVRNHQTCWISKKWGVHFFCPSSWMSNSCQKFSPYRHYVSCIVWKVLSRKY
jgi:hypothetical protein